MADNFDIEELYHQETFRRLAGLHPTNSVRPRISFFDFSDLIINLRNQIRPKCEKDDEQDLKLILTVPKVDVKSQCARKGKIEMANAGIYCNRDDPEELLKPENAEDDPRENGNIIMEEYSKLLRNEKIRTNFLLKILERAVSEHKVYTIYGTFPPLKKPLVDRGWIDKRIIRRMRDISASSNVCEGTWV